MALAGAFVKDLLDGKVEGLDPGTYLGYEDYSFWGQYLWMLMVILCIGVKLDL